MSASDSSSRSNILPERQECPSFGHHELLDRLPIALALTYENVEARHSIIFAGMASWRSLLEELCPSRSYRKSLVFTLIVSRCRSRI